MVTGMKYDVKELDSLKIYSRELLAGKVALVTGGSNGGMLKEISKAFMLHGCAGVALMARKAEKLQTVVEDLNKVAAQNGSKAICIAVPGDVRSPESCEGAVKAVIDRFGRFDILVNGAAGNFLATAEKLSTNGFKTVMDIDTVGTFNMSRAAFKLSMKKNGGNIINISALLHWNGTAMQVHSSAAKAAVDAITKVLAVEWGPYNVRVNGIVPGAIKGTEGFERLGNLSNLNNKEATNKAMENKSSSKNGSLTSNPFPLPLQRMGEV